MYSLGAYKPSANSDLRLTGINLIDKVLFSNYSENHFIQNQAMKRNYHCSTKPGCVNDVLYVYITLLRILIQHKLATGNGMLLTSSFSFEDLTHETL